MTRSALAKDINAASHITGTFRLRSGTISNEYFDKYRFESNPALLKRVAEAMLPQIPKETEILAGLELGGVPIATALSLASGLPAVFVRKAAKEYGTCQAIEGADVGGRNITIIEDVISTGGAVVQSGGMLKEAGAKLLAVMCVIWRGPMPPSIDALDVPVIPLFVKSELD